MIPIRDVVPSRTFPVVTLAIITANVAAFAYEQSLGSALDPFLADHGLIPSRFSFATLLTSMFLHGGLLHVATNVLYLWIFGDNVEDRIGHGRFVAFYLLCGATAAAAQVLMTPASPVPIVGASGAIAGVMGAYFVLYTRSKIVTLVPIPFFVQLVEVPAVVFLGIWFMLQLVIGLGSVAATASAGPAGGAAVWAHLTGFVTGAAAVRLLRRPERQRVDWWDVTSP
jgi:membrane associated rhomboid family serine protease